ncbi:hypothetical protein ACOJQI_21230 [Bacillus salacetis]
MINLKRMPKVREVWLDEDIDEQGFADIISSIYKQGCYTYAIIPDWRKNC